ncbi:MAG: type IV secretory system conjugative DNA transfer family protein [Ruminococcus sp.]|nr:type IV secretory system conjugative DNA transfer family protein [Ruminococcus sp.]MCM1380972.1 type IV secretory system conjugative DNA transfer family protein [Muribaculaceae bacterium]MCM1479477.1 type IV secretory system conjugative DNA transfer family protein [Muribaculaceae bacterium]
MAKGNGMPKKKGMTSFIIYIVIAVVLLVVGMWGGYVLQETAHKNGKANFQRALDKSEDYINFESFINAAKSALSDKGMAQQGAMFGGMAGLLIFAYQISKTPKRFHRKGEEHGSARWGTDKEKQSVGDVNDFYNNAILVSDVFLVLDRKKRDENAAANKKNSGKKVAEKEKQNTENEPIVIEEEKLSISSIAEKTKKVQKIQAMLNLNMLILGGSGTGKSRFFVKPNIMQCNTSFVVTDPSGELIQSCGKMLERMGYEIKVFNIDNMEHSCNYNPFHYINDINGNYDENAVIKMINTFMINTKGEGQGGDPFWEDCTRLLLSAVCFLLVETAPEDECNFSGVLDIIHKAKVIEGKEEEKSEFDVMFDARKEKDPNALSVQYYDEFKQAAGKTMQSILISTTTRLQCFKLAKIRNLTCMDNIGLDTLGDKKTALFIIIPSTDSTYNFLAAMMYSQLFDSLYRVAISKYHGRLPVHVRFICDEFANTGKIPEFEKILATCRKFEISVQVILQNLSQLKRLYEKSWEEIPGNCDTTIFLGGKDQTNNEYIMKELGKETIDTMNVNKTKSKQGSTSYNDGILGRELMQLDELATMPNNECLVLIRGMRPFRTDKFDIVNHPRYGMLDEADKANNTYYLAENITTAAEGESITFEYYDTGEVKAGTVSAVMINFVSSDNDVIIPLSELNKNIKPEINAIFANITSAYSTEIA